jgi:hypothetical protein
MAAYDDQRKITDKVCFYEMEQQNIPSRDIEGETQLKTEGSMTQKYFSTLRSRSNSIVSIFNNQIFFNAAVGGDTTKAHHPFRK